MDEICSAVLKKINDIGEIGKFVIIEEEDLFGVLPDSIEEKDLAIKNSLKMLKDDGCIEVRYGRDNVYCVAPLKRFESTEREVDEKHLEPSKKFYVICALCSFGGAFLGGLLACLIAG